METVDFSRFFVSLAVVLALIWLLAMLAKRSGLDKKLRGATGGSGRLAVEEVTYLDPKRKLVLVRADKREYLLLLSGDSVSVIDKLDEKKPRNEKK